MSLARVEVGLQSGSLWRRALDLLWGMHLVAIPFQRILSLPIMEEKLQPAEILFLPLAFITLVLWIQGRVHWNFCAIDAGIGVWLIASLIGAATSGFSKISTLELVGTVYLTALYAVIRLTADEHRLKMFLSYLVLSALVAALVAIAGLLLARFGMGMGLAYFSKSYPYIGNIHRAMGFATSPAMLASILMFSVILKTSNCIGSRKCGKWDLTILIFLAVVLFLTFSKTILCALAGILVAYILVRNRGNLKPAKVVGLAVTCLILAILFTLGSHVTLLKEDAGKLSAYKNEMHIAGKPLARWHIGGQTYLLMGTNYYFNKRASLLAIDRSFLWGVGPGQFNQFISALQEEGVHPATLWKADPHSTYTGSFAELGIFGFIALLTLWSTVGTRIFKLVKENHENLGLTAGLAGMYVAILIEAISTDVMNFRQYWWLFGIVGALAVIRPQNKSGLKPIPG